MSEAHVHHGEDHLPTDLLGNTELDAGREAYQIGYVLDIPPNERISVYVANPDGRYDVAGVVVSKRAVVIIGTGFGTDGETGKRIVVDSIRDVGYSIYGDTRITGAGDLIRMGYFGHYGAFLDLLDAADLPGVPKGLNPLSGLTKAEAA